MLFLSLLVGVVACQKAENIVTEEAPIEETSILDNHQKQSIKTLQENYPDFYANLQFDTKQEDEGILAVPVYNKELGMTAILLSSSKRTWLLDVDKAKKSLQLVDVEQQSVVGIYELVLNEKEQVYSPVIDETKISVCEAGCIALWAAASGADGPLPIADLLAALALAACLDTCDKLN